MKKRTISRIIITCGLSLVMSATAVSVSLLNSGHLFKAEAATMPTTISLKDNTAGEIKEYYSSLNGKSAEELKGTNLLKNLKGIINHNVNYFSYSQVQSIYVITDRDWKNSPASEMSGYNSSNNTITSFSHSTEVSNNPYLHLLYCDYSIQEKTHYKGDGDLSSSSVSFDMEHAWSQSHGFKTPSEENLTGAGSDLHHLKAGTQYGNRTLHNNYSYGFVKDLDVDYKNSAGTVTYEYEKKNKRGTPLFAHSGQDKENRVFEPQDSDKGDIARALLYMVACYNNYDGGTITPANPALKLVNYVISGDSTGFSSDNLENGYYGVLQDILAWHAMDPVDEYEIHRNNLIYNNYQHNRNPFIDYPEWVEYIWGTSKYDGKTIEYNDTPTGNADLSKDVINGYRDGRSGTNITPADDSDSKKGFDFVKNWWIFVVIGVVVVIVIVLICVGVVKVKVSKKGKVKLKANTSSKKSSSKKSSSSKKKK